MHLKTKFTHTVLKASHKLNSISSHLIQNTVISSIVISVIRTNEFIISFL